MKSNYSKKGMLKTLSLLAMGALMSFSLTSCKGKVDPYDGINKDSTYASLGSNYSVSNLDVFNELKYNANDYLSKRIQQALVQSYIDQIKDVIETKGTADEKYEEYMSNVQKYFICAAYEVSDLDAYEDLVSETAKYQKKFKYIDAQYLKGITLSSAEFDGLTDIDNLSKKSFAELTDNQKTVLQEYYFNYAEKLFAYDALEKKIADFYDDKDNEGEDYYTDEKIVNTWKTDYLYNQYMNVLNIRFISEDELKETFKTFGIKAYKKSLYFLPQTGVQKDGENVNLTDNEYSTWYDDFDFTTNLNNRQNCIKLTDDAIVLQIYVAMYNYIYTYRDALPMTDEVKAVFDANDTNNRRDVTDQIVQPTDLTVDSYFEMLKTSSAYTADKDSTENYFTFNGEKISKISSTLKTRLYDTFSTEDGEQRYDYEGNNYGDYYYISFKITEPEDLGEDSLEYDEDDYTIDREKYASIVDKVIATLKDDDLTDDNIASALEDALKEDAKVLVYDDVMEIVYMSSSYAINYSQTKKKSPENGVLASIKYNGVTTYIKAEEVWKALEPDSGITTAIDLLTKQVIKNTDAYKNIDSKTKSDYYTTLSNILTSFANGGLESSGYKADLGKYNFLMLYFHTADVNEIIDNYFLVNEASNKLINDYTNDNLSSFLMKYTSSLYDSYFSISASNLLVYVDMDEDATPDKDFDWSTALPNDPSKTYGEFAQELMNDLIRLTENSSDTHKTTLTSIVDEYNSSSRFTNGHDTGKTEEDSEYDPTEPDSYWAKYRRVGLNIRLDDYSEINNSSDYTAIEIELKDRLLELYNSIIMGDNVPTEYLDSNAYVNGNGFSTQYGYNMLLVTSATVKESAKFTADDDKNGIYTNIVYNYGDNFYKVNDLYSDSDTLSLNQIKAYLLEYVQSNTTNTIPSDVTTAISSFLTPVYTRYTDSSSQREVLIAWLEKESNNSFTFGDNGNDTATQTERLNHIIEINQRSADSYNVESIDGVENPGYDSSTNQYPDWWTAIREYVSNTK